MVLDAYVNGATVWFTDKAEAYVGGIVGDRQVEGDLVTLTFYKDATGEVVVIKAKDDQIENLPALRNPPLLEATDDLTNLSYLNEASVLQNLKARYATQNVYTYSGIVLIAMNPFAKIPIYTNELIHAYSGKRRGELEPHLFAIGEEAYRGMLIENKNQTVVISGESGAGKTVSAKFIMRYFATSADPMASQLESKSAKFSEVEEKIMATNPILESFGNAKTTRNDNSSRFGKYIELHFGMDNTIVGAKIRVYLLERSRLIIQPPTERNYHIFYQLCIAAPPSERTMFHLKNQEEFFYTNQGGIGTIPGVNDTEEFALTREAMSTVGMSVQRQWEIFRILAGLLQVGNIDIKQMGKANASIADNDPALLYASELLGIDKAAFSKWMVNKQTMVRKEKIISKLNQTQALSVRDAAVKFIYAKLFDWLVMSVNEVLFNIELASQGQFIGVLDIYGFEHFEKNSFEQFCINYANEKLQQEFNKRVFKMEQDEYVKEQINWSFIEFSDNQACIDIIESRTGIITLLDEESRIPSGTDANLLQKLHTSFATPQNAKYYKKPRFAGTDFTIGHYACDVTYDAEGFLDKNRDTVPDEIMDTIMASKFEFLIEMLKATDLEEEDVQSPRSSMLKSLSIGKANNRMSMMDAAAAAKKKTLGSVFKASLIELMTTINSTNVHYIRCIKPNEAKVSWKFESKMVLGQLRACGVLETIKISSKGYPTKRTLPEFADRYHPLVHSSIWKGDLSTLCLRIIESAGLTSDLYQIGTTKLFFRAGQLARLEQCRKEKMDYYTILIQKNMRANLWRNVFLELKETTIYAQKLLRAKFVLQNLRRNQQEEAAIYLQTLWRKQMVHKQHVQFVQKVTKIQSVIRMHLTKKQVLAYRKEIGAISVQRIARGWLQRTRYQKLQKKILLIQSVIRGRLAKKSFRKLRAEATSLTTIKYELENKVIEISQNLQAEQVKNRELREQITVLEMRCNGFKDKNAKLETKNHDLEARLISIQKEHTDAQHAAQAEKSTWQEKHAVTVEKLLAAESALDKMKEELIRAQAEITKLKEVASTPTSLAPMQSPVTRRQSLNRQATLRTQAAPPALSYNSPPVSGRALVLELPPKPIQRNEDPLLSIQRSETPEPSLTPVPEAESPKIPPSISSMASEDTLNTAEFNLGSPVSVDFDEGRSLRLRKRMTSNSLTAADMKRTSGMLRRSKTTRISYIMKQPSENDKQKLSSILSNPGLEVEILEGLIKTLSVPALSDIKYTAKEILFPSHIIGLTIAHMWSIGLTEMIKNILFKSLKTMQQQLSRFLQDYSFAFWLSNVMELLSILTNVEIQMTRSDLHQNSDIRRVVSEVKGDLRMLAGQIYAIWMKNIKMRIDKVIVPALIESQPLPGFQCNLGSGGFFSRFMTAQTNAVKIDDLISFLNKLWEIIDFYYVDEAISHNVVLEVYDYVGMVAFNHLITTKNFCSWKRGVQIQYNVSRLDDWRQQHKIQPISENLERVAQAAKLFQGSKTNIEDVDTMIDICNLLNTTQIKKLLLVYVSDYENPISATILKEITDRGDANSEQGLYLRSKSRIENSTYLLPRAVVTVENYLPSWLDLPKVQLFVKLVTTGAQ